MSSLNGSITMVADTWYQVPIVVPVALSELKVTQEVNSGTVRWAFVNTGTPSTTNGPYAPGELIINLTPGDKVYYGSSVTGDIINYTIRTL